jgi:hypothetical protein
MSGELSSGSLAARLGIRSGSRIAVLNPPYPFVRYLETIRETLREMRMDIETGVARDLDLIIYFSRGSRGLEENFPVLKEQLAPDGMLWIGWRKPRKGQKAEIDEGQVREIGRKHGMAGGEALSIDEEWSALRFARRQ